MTLMCSFYSLSSTVNSALHTQLVRNKQIYLSKLFVLAIHGGP